MSLRSANWRLTRHSNLSVLNIPDTLEAACAQMAACWPRGLATILARLWDAGRKSFFCVRTAPCLHFAPWPACSRLFDNQKAWLSLKLA